MSDIKAENRLLRATLMSVLAAIGAMVVFSWQFGSQTGIIITKVDAVGVAVSETNTKVEVIDSELEAVSNKLIQVETYLKVSEGQIADLEEDVDLMEGNVVRHEMRLNALESGQGG